MQTSSSGFHVYMPAYRKRFIPKEGVCLEQADVELVSQSVTDEPLNAGYANAGTA